jgi:hypothetical protein
MDKVICPHCGYKYNGLDAAFMKNLGQTWGDSFEETCVECGKAFIVTLKIKATYETKKPELPS